MTFRPASAPGDFASPLPCAAGRSVASSIRLSAPCLPPAIQHGTGGRARPASQLCPAPHRSELEVVELQHLAGQVQAAADQHARWPIAGQRAQGVHYVRTRPGDAARRSNDRLDRPRIVLPGFGHRPQSGRRRQPTGEGTRQRPSSASCRRSDAPADPTMCADARPARCRRRDCARRRATAPNPPATARPACRAGVAAAPATPRERCPRRPSSVPKHALPRWRCRRCRAGMRRAAMAAATPGRRARRHSDPERCASRDRAASPARRRVAPRSAAPRSPPAAARRSPPARPRFMMPAFSAAMSGSVSPSISR